MMLELKFDSKAVKQPIISKTSMETRTLINIIRASIGARQGEMVVEVDDSQAERVIEEFKKYGVEILKLGVIVKNEDKCVHCGACISICPVEVFELNGDKKVVADTSKCIHCGICVNVCPLEALSLP
jgi:NAD-dependent dihydropyrimidine dehydrogenase PreA subunit